MGALADSTVSNCALADGTGAAESGEFDAVIADHRLSADSALVNKLLAARLPTVIVSAIGEKPMADWWSSLRRQRTVTAPVKPALLRAALQELFGAPPAIKPVAAAPSWIMVLMKALGCDRSFLSSTA